MRSVGSRDTGPEMILRSALWSEGLRYRVQTRVVGTRPDLVFLRKKLAVFVDGCFWHGCPEHYGEPKSNSAFWRNKLVRNIERDTRDRLRLETAGWQVMRFWQCEISNDLKSVVQQIRESLAERRS
jgi:DNA mismatch endonuclease (patch repair protein)